MEEIDLTIKLLGQILLEVGMGKAASLLREYLDRKESEKQMSLSELNLYIKDYIDKYMVHDINNGSRMVKLGNFTQPFNRRTNHGT